MRHMVSIAVKGLLSANKLLMIFINGVEFEDCNLSKFPVKFHPSKTFKFQNNCLAKKRGEVVWWCEDFEWLHYDVESDSAFCHLCQIVKMEKKLLASTKLFLVKDLLIGKK